jgi:F0F1-type ATP synthase assembly protein I
MLGDLVRRSVRGHTIVDVDPQEERRKKIRRRVIGFRVGLWVCISLMLIGFGIAALLHGDSAGAAILLPFGVVAALVAFRTGSERRGHTVMTALLSRRDPDT